MFPKRPTNDRTAISVAQWCSRPSDQLNRLIIQQATTQLTRVWPPGRRAHLPSNRQDHAITSFVRANRDVIIIIVVVAVSISSRVSASASRGITIDILLVSHRSEFGTAATTVRWRWGGPQLSQLGYGGTGKQRVTITSLCDVAIHGLKSGQTASNENVLQATKPDILSAFLNSGNSIIRNTSGKISETKSQEVFLILH